jgi:hypothetical protein
MREHNDIATGAERLLSCSTWQARHSGCGTPQRK